MADPDSKPEIISRKEALAVGLMFYFTGKPCKRGHIARRYSNNLTCEVCAKASAVASQKRDPERRKEVNRRAGKKFYEINKAMVNAKIIEWQRQNPEKVRARSRRYYERDPERSRNRARVWYNNNKPIAAAMAKRWYAANTERARKNSKEWRRNNLDKAKELSRNRRAREKGAAGTHTAADIAEILKLQKGKCAYCRVSFKRVGYQVDHIKSLLRGGSNYRNNLQLLCLKCNSDKRAKDPLDYAQSLGKLL